MLKRAYERGSGQARGYTDQMLATVSVTAASKVGENGNSLYEVVTRQSTNATHITINRRLVTSSKAVAPFLWTGLGFGAYAHAFRRTPDAEFDQLVRQAAIDKRARSCSFAQGLAGRFPCGPTNYVFAPSFADFALNGQTYRGRDLPRYWVTARRMSRFLKTWFVYPEPDCTEEQRAGASCS